MTPKATLPFEAAKAREILRQMLLVRRFEEAVIRHRNDFPGGYHVYIGQEATGIGVCAALAATDYLCSTHRNHGHLLARGVAPRLLMAEIFGRASGLNKGFSGSMHMASAEARLLASSAMVGGAIPVITGAGLASQVRNSKEVGVGFFGEGAVNEGAFFESINMAALWQLPVIYVCENNTSILPGEEIDNEPGLPPPFNPDVNITKIAEAFNMQVLEVDGADVVAMYRATEEAVRRGRAGDGPTFIEARTYPWPGDSVDPDELPEGETDLLTVLDEPRSGRRTWTNTYDPLVRFTRLLLAAEVVDAKALADLDAAIRLQMDDAVAFAKAAPQPAGADALKFVLAA